MTTSIPSTTVVDDIDDEALDNAAKKRLGFGFWVAASWIGLVSLAALLAPWLPIADPNEIANGAPRDGILGDNFMGTDALGRDVFARTIWGARISLGVGFLGILLGIVVGGALGIAAGYFKGLADQIISFLVFSLLSYPSLVLALLRKQLDSTRAATDAEAVLAAAAALHQWLPLEEISDSAVRAALSARQLATALGLDGVDHA